jgi:hypothetical protein
MQELYYVSEANYLTLIREDKSSITWPSGSITDLVVSASLLQIVAFSASGETSVPVAFFPISSTDIYYQYPDSISPTSIILPAVSSSISSSITWYYSITGITSNATLSASYCQFYTGSAYYISQSGNSVNGLISVPYDTTYKVATNGTGSSYSCSIAIYDNNTDAYPFAVFSTSSNNSISSGSFYVSQSHNYSAYFNIAYPNVSYWFDTTSSYSTGMKASSSFAIYQEPPFGQGYVALKQSGSISGSISGSSYLVADVMTLVYINVNDNYSFTGSLSIYDVTTNLYVNFQSNVTGSNTYLYNNWYPQLGHSYIISASIGATGSLL